MRNVVHNLFGQSIWWIISLAILAGCQGQLPDQLIGTWGTDDHRYVGRTLQIGADTIVFTADENNKILGSIRRVCTKTGDASLSVKIVYVDNQEESKTVELVYLPEYGGSLLFRNQPRLVWKKVKQ